MRTVNIHEAKTHLSRIVDDVAAGDEVIIAKAGRPVARLVALEAAPGRRVLGALKGAFIVPDDYDDPLPEATLREFEA